MARMCDICGKSTQKGNAIETRGKAKYLGGVGTKITGKPVVTSAQTYRKSRAATPNGGVKDHEGLHSVHP